MSVDLTEKSSRKHKKAKDVASTLDVQERDADKPRKSKRAKAAGEAPAPVETSEVKQPITSRKEKKHKKRKHEEEPQGPLSVDATVEEPEKKKRKHKSGEVDVDGEEESAADEVKKERTKKKKKKATTTDVEGDVEEAAVQGKKAHRKKSEAEEPAGLSAPSDTSPAKAKKEKKKKRKTNDAEDEDAAKSDIADSDKKSKKKRKRHSTSGFPDPSEDESLSEQAQKALQYAFAQFDDPSSWKFNKARQNWLIRNVWSEEAIPETYMPLVTKYLQGVQGGSREALIKLCREATESPKPPATEPVTAAPDAQAGATPDGQMDSPAKRTVKFAVEEPADSNKTDQADEIKRHRATALLAVLTTTTST